MLTHSNTDTYSTQGKEPGRLRHGDVHSRLQSRFWRYAYLRVAKGCGMIGRPCLSPLNQKLFLMGYDDRKAGVQTWSHMRPCMPKPLA